MNYLGQNLHFLRNRSGYKQAEMLDIIGISGATWSDYENQKTEPKINKLIEISEFFGVDLDGLLTVDLSENVHLIGKTADGIDLEKSPPKSLPNCPPNSEFLLKEGGEDRYQNNGQATVIELLASLVKQVGEISAKMDK